MAQALNETIGQLNTDKLLADPRGHYVTTDELLATSTSVTRGQLLKFASGKVSVAGANDDVFGIAAANASTTAGDVSVPVYVFGSFNADVVAAANSLADVSTVYVKCRNIGLILRQPEAAIG